MNNFFDRLAATARRLPRVVTLGLLVLGSGAATWAVSSARGECCAPGAACCTPGAACCHH